MARSILEDEPELTGNSRTVLDRRYLAKDRSGRPAEGPDDMFRRVARDLSLADLEYGAGEEERRAAEKEFYEAMRRLDVMPNSPTPHERRPGAAAALRMLRAPGGGLPRFDLRPGETHRPDPQERRRHRVQLHQDSGPRGTWSAPPAEWPPGPVSFIRAFDTATDVVKQGGTRRGANMGILNVDHPDVMAFIESKRDGKNLSNFNISVGISNEFMEKLKTGERYDLVNPRTGEKTGTLDAREVFGRIAEMAWETGDPGLVFLDQINRDNPNPKLGWIESTNPCVTGDTVVMTSEGPFRADDLVGRQFEAMVDGVPHPSGPEGFFSTGVRDVVRITGSNLPGSEAGKPVLTLTPDHLVVRTGDKTTDWTTTWTPAGEIKTGDRIRKHDHSGAGNGQAAEPAVTTAMVHSNKVTGIEPAGTQEVFDVHVPGVNAFDANGFYVHNCGEQALLPYESCNLASVNLARMVRYPEDGPVEMDWERLKRVVRTTVHMLDNVIDRNNYPIKEIGEMSRSTRRIGLGVMGFADLLVMMGIPYDSEEGIQTAREVMKNVRDWTHGASAELATYRGVYPAWEESVYDPPAESGEEAVQMRNSAPTTIAPTGTISIIAGASSGIEPLFALSYVRNVMDNTRLIEGNPHFEAAARHEGIYSEELMEELARSGSLSGLDPRFGVPEWMKRVFRTSHDISPEWHVRMQAAFQEYTDNSVSKTINFPQERPGRGRGPGLHAGLRAGLQGHHRLPGRQQGGSGPEHRRDRCGRAGSRGHAGNGGQRAQERGRVPDPQGETRHDLGDYGEDQDRPREHIRHNQLGRERQAVRGVREPGQGRRLRRRPDGGGLPDGVAGAPGQDRPGGDHRAAAGDNLLPRLARRDDGALQPGRGGHGPAAAHRQGTPRSPGERDPDDHAGRSTAARRRAAGAAGPEMPRLQRAGHIPRGVRQLHPLRLEQMRVGPRKGAAPCGARTKARGAASLIAGGPSIRPGQETERPSGGAPGGTGTE